MTNGLLTPPPSPAGDQPLANHATHSLLAFIGAWNEHAPQATGQLLEEIEALEVASQKVREEVVGAIESGITPDLSNQISHVTQY